MDEVKKAEGFFKALFDFSFSTFITSKIIKFLYILFVIFAALGAIGIIVSGFSSSVGMGLLSLIVLAPLAFLLWVITSRVFLEIIIVVFRIGDDLSDLKQRKSD